MNVPERSQYCLQSRQFEIKRFVDFFILGFENFELKLHHNQWGPHSFINIADFYEH